MPVPFYPDVENFCHSVERDKIIWVFVVTLSTGKPRLMLLGREGGRSPGELLLDNQNHAGNVENSPALTSRVDSWACRFSFIPLKALFDGSSFSLR